MIAVSEAARNIICSGAVPAAITNCLNFGNPYNTEVYYQFVYALKGMSDACLKFDTPVTGGNVSFYNQSPDGAVYPTPTIGMVGVIEDITKRMTLDFKQLGDKIYVVGTNKNDIGSSEYVHKIKNITLSPAPLFNLDEEFQVQQTVLQLIQNGTINAAHDVSEGGLFTALFESAMPNELGFTINTNSNIRKDAFLFGENQSRIVVTVSAEKENDFLMQLNNTPYENLGYVSKEIFIDNENWGMIDDFKYAYDHAIENSL
jgi:phosphoribosylformylglycinamidine synthase